MAPKYWFKRKTLGWGLEPGSREGWVATALFFITEVGGVAVLGHYFVRTQPGILIAWAIVWLVAFLGLAIVKGEKLQWPPGS